jgi:hypothetical protein
MRSDLMGKKDDPRLNLHPPYLMTRLASFSLFRSTGTLRGAFVAVPSSERLIR